MKTVNGFAAAVAGLAMLATPIAASATTANPAASLSVVGARTGTPTTGKSKLGASVPTATLISIGVLGALVVGVLVATGGKGSPASN